MPAESLAILRQKIRQVRDALLAAVRRAGLPDDCLNQLYFADSTTEAFSDGFRLPENEAKRFSAKLKSSLHGQPAFPTARCTPNIEASTSAKPASDFASMPWPRNSQPSTKAQTGLSNPSDDTAAGGSLAMPSNHST